MNIYHYGYIYFMLKFYISYLINVLLIYRKVLEQACVQTLSPRKMKILFMKFINFEEKYGTAEAITHIRQMAANYVEKHI